MTKVKLTFNTFNILANLAQINPSLMVRKGNFLNTQSVGENIIVEYVCSEEWPQDFAIYELHQFIRSLGIVSDNIMSDAPIFKFDNENYVSISSSFNSRSLKYFFSNKQILESCAPEKKISFPEENTIMEFDLSLTDLRALVKASNSLNINDVVFSVIDEKTVNISVLDFDNDTNNEFSIQLPGTCDVDKKKNVHMKMENIKLVEGDYKIKLTDTVITKWKHSNIDLAYYIGIEPEVY